MIFEGNVIGVIVAFGLDRDGNDFVIRGSLLFFDKPIILLTQNALKKAGVIEQYVYTNQKGIVFKSILNRNTKYIVRKHECLYTNNNVLMDFSGVLNNVKDIIIIDPKYPLLDNALLEELLEKHKQCNSDLTYIKGVNRSTTFIPNVFVIDKLFFEKIFSNEIYSKNIEINKLIKIAESMCKSVHFVETVYVYKISMVSNKKSLILLESILINRK